MFTERTKMIALAIVKIFETGKPFGNYSAVAVLKDGAGISYGTSQFTHRSGSLGDVVKRYERITGGLPTAVALAYPDLVARRNVAGQSRNEALKAALRKLGKTPGMQQAQREIAFENYLKPALDACEGSDFTMPLSLAVIYDSINHGSYDKIRDRVKFQRPGNGSIKPEEFEREWITEYVNRRDDWLEGHKNPLLRSTDYRTDFFLAQIARNNWQLRLPLNVNGHQLTEAILFPSISVAAAPSPESETSSDPADGPVNSSPSTGGQALPGDDSTQAPINQGPATQVAEQIINTGDSVTPELPADGGGATDSSVQASQGGLKSLVATIMGSIGGAATAVWGALTSDTGVMIVGILCVTSLLLALIFRQVLMDWLRMKLHADPKQGNVK